MIECPVCKTIMFYDEFIRHTRKSIPYNCIKYWYDNNLKKDKKELAKKNGTYFKYSN